MMNSSTFIQPKSRSFSSVEGGRNRFVLKSVAYMAFGAMMALSPVLPFDHQVKAQTSPPEPACLVSTGSAQAITIIVPQARADGLAAQGFASIACGDAPDIAKYRSQICALAQTASEAVKAGFASAYAIRPETLCTYAQEIG